MSSRSEIILFHNMYKHKGNEKINCNTLFSNTFTVKCAFPPCHYNKKVARLHSAVLGVDYFPCVRVGRRLTRIRCGKKLIFL
jgi:hypothetical protein